MSAAALQDRVVLLAGATGGLGSAAAVACAQAGATVVLLGRSVRKLGKLYDAVAGVGPEPAMYPLDLEGAGPDDYLELADRIQSQLRRLDGLLHCAAHFQGLTPLGHVDPAELARALHVNLTARGWLTQACLPLLERSDAGAVVFVVDDPARSGKAFWGGYGLAQPALHAMVPMLQAEIGSTGPRISGLQPGPMRTGLRSAAYMAGGDTASRDPALYAPACVELLSPAGEPWRGRVRVETLP